MIQQKTSLFFIFFLWGTITLFPTRQNTDVITALQTVTRNVAKESRSSVVRIDILNSEGAICSFGSGFIFQQNQQDVYILTNYHVVSGAVSGNGEGRLRITLHNDKQFIGTGLGKDTRTDLAVVKFIAPPNTRFPVMKLGDSSKLEVGDWVISIGNPFGFNNSVAIGIVSALGRATLAGTAYATDYIQTDAAVNPGNSGGPLVNLYGEVVGINSWIASMSGDNSGLSFAIPINTANNVLQSLTENKVIEYAWLGVLVTSLTDSNLRETLGLTFEHGAYITQIVEDSPADTGELAVGDIILAVNGEKIRDANALVWNISKYPPGTTIQLKVFDGEKEKTVSITLQRRPGSPENSSSIDSANNKETFLGAVFENITPENKKQYSLKDKPHDGVIITGFSQKSPAAAYGLIEGDLVLKINQQTIKTLSDITALKETSSKKKTKFFYFKINRNGREMLVGVTN